MPIYDYGCAACGHVWEASYLIAEREKPISEACPNCQKTGGITKDITSLNIVSGTGLHAKVPQGFREVLSKVKQAHPHHKIDGDLS